MTPEAEESIRTEAIPGVLCRLPPRIPQTRPSSMPQTPPPYIPQIPLVMYLRPFLLFFDVRPSQCASVQFLSRQLERVPRPSFLFSINKSLENFSSAQEVPCCLGE